MPPLGLDQLFWKKFGGQLADPYLRVKYAVRYKGSGEIVGTRAWPFAAATAAEVLDGQTLDVDEGAVVAAAPTGVRFAELPSFVFESGARGIERALRERLADKLEVTVWVDPVTKEASQPGEAKEAFAARVSSTVNAPAVASLRERIDKKRRDLVAREQDLSGRRTEKWAALGTAVLSNIGLFTRRKRTISGASSVLTKNRMENTAEARVEALRAEIASLETELADHTDVDSARFQTVKVVPTRTQVKLLRYDLVWVF